MPSNATTKAKLPLAQRFRDTPIQRKLLLVSALVTALALALAGAAIFTADAILFHRNLQNDLNALAQITADDSSAALAFEDPNAGTEIVTALRARPHIMSACLYRPDGSLLAHYLRHGGQACSAADAKTRNEWFSQSITIVSPVLQKGLPVGTLILLADTGAAYQRMRVYGAIIILVLLSSSFIAFLISTRLSDLISMPILELAQTSAKISHTRDYSIRARKLSADELGLLVDAFNQMLADIQSRDSELRRALEQLQESNEDLARSNDDLERFAFVASHDLQEPLRMMAVFSQLLARKYANVVQAEGQRYLDNIVDGAKRMRELLIDLLEYAHLSSEPDAPMQQVDLNLVLNNAKENLNAAIQQNAAIITADPLPTVSAYEAHMLPLFQNLIGNAIKYHSEQPPCIDIRVFDAGQQHRFEISDNGIGIEPAYYAQIFVAFKRLHGKEIAGTGIGLAICHRIIERYGGRIWVESEFGKGSKFIFTFPKIVARTGHEAHNG